MAQRRMKGICGFLLSEPKPTVETSETGRIYFLDSRERGLTVSPKVCQQITFIGISESVHKDLDYERMARKIQKDERSQHKKHIF